MIPPWYGIQLAITAQSQNEIERHFYESLYNGITNQVVFMENKKQETMSF